MNNIPIEIGVTKKTRANNKKTPKISASEITEIKKTIFARDQNTCQGCGFVSKKYQELHHINANKENFKEDNLTTLCIFCHQCFDIEKVSEMRSGALIWLPEIPQTTLHHIARSIYIARISQGPVAEAARKALDVIMSRREEAKRRITTDDPYILSTVMGDYLNPKAYANRSKKLEGIRLFPLDRRIIKEADLEFNQFPQILAYWRSKDGPFGGSPPPKWVSVYQNFMAQSHK